MVKYLSFKDRERGNIVSTVAVLVVLAALVAGVYLVQTKQILKSKASSDPIKPVGANVHVDSSGNWSADSSTVNFELSSPLGPPQPARQ